MAVHFAVYRNMTKRERQYQNQNETPGLPYLPSTAQTVSTGPWRGQVKVPTKLDIATSSAYANKCPSQIWTKSKRRILSSYPSRTRGKVAYLYVYILSPFLISVLPLAYTILQHGYETFPYPPQYHRCSAWIISAWKTPLDSAVVSRGGVNMLAKNCFTTAIPPDTQ